MADDGFTPQVEWILRHCTGRSQTMLFSATLDGDVGHHSALPVRPDRSAGRFGDGDGGLFTTCSSPYHMDQLALSAIRAGIPKILVFSRNASVRPSTGIAISA